MEQPRISGLIHTRDEETNIANAINSLLPWVDEVVVVDMYSTDATRAIAEQMGARVFLHPPADYADPARNFGIAQTAGEWIIILDADELIPSTLASRLRAIAAQDEADVVLVPRRNYLLGIPFTGAGWGMHEDTGPRFFKRADLLCPAEIHSPYVVRDGARTLRLAPEAETAILHFNYLDASHVISKLNRYTTIEARLRHDRAQRPSTKALLLRPLRSFLSRYVYRRGYRMGWRGFFMCASMVFYDLSIEVKLRELVAAEGSAATVYGKIAEHTLAAPPRSPRPVAESQSSMRP